MAQRARRSASNNFNRSARKARMLSRVKSSSESKNSFAMVARSGDMIHPNTLRLRLVDLYRPILRPLTE